MNSVSEWLWIDSRYIRFHKDEGGALIASWNGLSAPVKVCRLFPVTRGDCWIAVADLEGNEWGVLRTASGIEEASRAALESELRIRPYLPRIVRISSIRRQFNQFIWEVDTDYGKLRFKTGPIYEAIVVMQDGIRQATDLEDQKYVIAADSDLDKSSRKMLARWL